MATEHKTMSAIARDFINNAIDPDLSTVPGLGEKAIKLLNDQGIYTTDQLVGQFFMVNRDEVEFIKFLEECGIKNQFAREVSSKMYSKLANI
jgi:predicted flap endonuclease-1-like 5' DNA nuclease